MEFLQGLFFNAVWFLVGAVAFFALVWIFGFIALPLWLEFGIILALSVLFGLLGMFVFINKTMGKSWRQTWSEDGFVFLGLAAPVVAACVVAVAAHLILNFIIKNQDLQKWIICLVAGIFWCCAMSAMTKYANKKSEKQVRGQTKKRKH